MKKKRRHRLDYALDAAERKCIEDQSTTVVIVMFHPNPRGSKRKTADSTSTWHFLPHEGAAFNGMDAMLESWRRNKS